MPSNRKTPEQWIYIGVLSLIGGIVSSITIDQPEHVTFLLGFLSFGLISYIIQKHDHLKLIRLFFKNLGKAPIIGVIAYALWCFILFVYIKEWSTGSVFLDEAIQSYGTPSKFIISYAPSALDSLIFFILVGGILTAHSMKQPEDEKLSRKIEHIFPEVPTESKLSKHLIDKISELACINQLTERTISITEFSKDDKFLKLSIKSHSIIKNMHHNHAFSQSNMPWSFSVDSCKPNTDILGEVHEVSVVHNITRGSEEKHLLQGIATLTKDNMSHSLSYALDINAEKEVLYQANAWAWEDINKKWTFNSSRYTEVRKFIIHNGTDTPFEIETELSDTNGDALNNKDARITISPDETKTICHNQLLPDETISLSINEISGNTEGSMSQETVKKEKKEVSAPKYV